MNTIETAIQGIQNGETHLFEIIIESFQQQLFHYCYHLLGNIQEAEDAVQDSFLKAFEKITSYHKSISFSAWLYKITYNHCINILRRRKLLSFISFSEDTHMDNHMYCSMINEVDENDLDLLMISALKQLSSKEKSILFLRVLEERSFDEIGSILHLKSANVRKKYERLRRKLKKFLISLKEGGTSYERYSVSN